jgi:hypothetical protein
MADLSFGQVGDKKASIVHGEPKVHTLFDLAENVANDGIQKKLAEFVLNRCNGLTLKARVIKGVPIRDPLRDGKLDKTALVENSNTVRQLAYRLSGTAFAQSSARFTITRSVIAGGGRTLSTSSRFQLSSTIGQPVAAVPSSSRFSIQGGFWISPFFALQVQMTGLGTLSPDYSNALLTIGQNYSMTASPGTGFMFTNWTGGTELPLEILTNGTTVQFLMQPNLTLQANFVDTTRPTLSITNLASGQRVSNAVFTVKGTANDNWMVSNVWCQIDGLGWNAATNINHWTNWAAGVTLIPGTNVVQAYAVDTSGNLSTTDTVNFDFVVTNQLRVSLTGLGSISPNYSNAWLEIGRNYSMTATPASGFNFTNWVVSTNGIGGTKTNGATVLFMMASNLTLQVNFVDVTKPTLTITAPTSGQHMTNALATVVGTASDNWGVTDVWYQFNTNPWSLATSTNGWTNWTVTLTLAAGTNTVKAYAVDFGANLSTTNNVSFVSSNAFKLLLVFTTVQPLATNGLNFVLEISPGLSGHVQVSTDLVEWVTLTNFVGTNTTLNFRDSAATNFNTRLYRAVSP